MWDMQLIQINRQIEISNHMIVEQIIIEQQQTNMQTISFWHFLKNTNVKTVKQTINER